MVARKKAIDFHISTYTPNRPTSESSINALGSGSCSLLVHTEAGILGNRTNSAGKDFDDENFDKQAGVLGIRKSAGTANHANADAAREVCEAGDDAGSEEGIGSFERLRTVRLAERRVCGAFDLCPARRVGCAMAQQAINKMWSGFEDSTRTHEFRIETVQRKAQRSGELRRRGEVCRCGRKRRERTNGAVDRGGFAENDGDEVLACYAWGLDSSASEGGAGDVDAPSGAPDAETNGQGRAKARKEVRVHPLQQRKQVLEVHEGITSTASAQPKH